ncbi:hypothetical protein ACFVZN_29515 [Streptomyces virginiae]|uniref:hypothetical protein n=2 Tax=Streptomyces virginiae TaxID=1961 RepID=UPI0036B9B81F
MTTTVPTPGEDAASASPPEATQAESSDPAADPAELLRRIRKETFTQFGGWMLGSVLFALTPTLIQYFAGRQTAGYVQPELTEMMSRAQLYLVSAGIAIQAIIQALIELRKRGAFRLIVLCLFNLIILVFALFLSSSADGPNAVKSVVGEQSAWLFFWAFVCAGSSTWICVKGAAERDAA